LDLIASVMDVPDKIDDVAILTDYAVTSRYPGEYASVDEAEYQEAVELARTVYDWVKEILS
jgi:HEPN domain-containing protein